MTHYSYANEWIELDEDAAPHNIMELREDNRFIIGNTQGTYELQENTIYFYLEGVLSSRCEIRELDLKNGTAEVDVYFVKPTQQDYSAKLKRI